MTLIRLHRDLFTELQIVMSVHQLVRENAGEAMVFPYIGWTIDISVTTPGGEEWPYYE